MANSIAGASIVAIAPYPIILIMQVVFASYLSVEEIGQFALVNFLLIFFMTSTNWGVDKYIIANKKISTFAINEIFSQELIFAVITYLLVLFFFRESVNTYAGLQDSNLFWAFLALIFLYHPLSRPKALMERDMLLFPAYIPALIANVLSACLGFILVIKGFGIWGMIVWKLGIFILEDLILFLFSRSRPRFNFSFDNINQHFRFCLPLFLGALLSFFAVTADIWIVRNLLGTFELGLYWFAFSISHTILALRAVIVRILLPALAAEEALGSKVKSFSRLNSALQIIFVAVAIIIAYWGADIFSAIFGSKWSRAAPLFVILFYAAVFKVISGTANSLLHSLMNTGIDLNVAIVNTLVLIPLVIVGTYFGGVKGTAVAVLVSTLAMTCYVYQRHVKSLCGLGFWYFFSYLLINIVILILVRFFFDESLEGLVIKITATAASFLFAYITLRLSFLTGREMSLSDVFFLRKQR